MEQLRAFAINETYQDKNQQFEVREKDMDDSICYEVILDGAYLFTISPEGKILFNSQSNKMHSTEMKSLIEKIKEQI